MESRVLGLLGVFLFIVCFAGYISYSGELDSKRNELREVAAIFESAKKGVDARRTLLNSAQEQLNSLQKQANNYNELTQNKQTLSLQITEVEASRKKLLMDFMGLVQRVRTSSEGMEFATLTLNSGQVLQGVKLQKITDTSVSISHSNGLIKVDGKDLPDDLRKRFRYGMEPTVATDDTTLGMAGATLSTVSSQTSDSTSKRDTPASHIQIEIDALDQKMAQLEKSKTEWTNLVNSYRSQAYSAQAAGRPTYNLRAQSTQAEQTLQTINNQFFKLQEEQVALRKKLATALAFP